MFATTTQSGSEFFQVTEESMVGTHPVRAILCVGRWSDQPMEVPFTIVSYYVETGLKHSEHTRPSERQTVWNFDGTVYAQSRPTKNGTETEQRYSPPWWDDVTDQTDPSAPWWQALRKKDPRPMPSLFDSLSFGPHP